MVSQTHLKVNIQLLEQSNSVANTIRVFRATPNSAEKAFWERLELIFHKGNERGNNERDSLEQSRR